MTFTLPAGHKWTDTEAALREAHDREYELRMAFFWECERLKAQLERLTEAGDAMASIIKYHPEANTFDPVPDVVKRWKAAKEGKQP